MLRNSAADIKNAEHYSKVEKAAYLCDLDDIVGRMISRVFLYRNASDYEPPWAGCARNPQARKQILVILRRTAAGLEADNVNVIVVSLGEAQIRLVVVGADPDRAPHTVESWAPRPGQARQRLRWQNHKYLQVIKCLVILDRA